MGSYAYAFPCGGGSPEQSIADAVFSIARLRPIKKKMGKKKEKRKEKKKEKRKKRVCVLERDRKGEGEGELEN